MDISPAAGPAAAACRRHRLSIDLNEIPSPSSDTQSSTPTSISAYEVALRFYLNPPFPQGVLAKFPGEAGAENNSNDYTCGVCGEREIKGETMVCDRCERGFHLGCVKIKGRQVVLNDDWVCGECKKRRLESRRWPLGLVNGGEQRGGVRMLDINEIPPSEGDGDGISSCTPNGSSAFDDDNR